MKTSVLVISNDQEEIEVIRRIFNRINGKIILLSVNSGRDALDALMGGFHGLKKVSPNGSPFRPDLILIDEELSDMRAYAFLEIIKKYYTLSQIKSFLLTEKIGEWQQDAYYNLVDGFLQRPITDDPETFEKFNQLVGQLNQDTMAGIPLLGFSSAGALKGKIITLKAAGSLFKAAACIAGVTLISAAVTDNNRKSDVAPEGDHGKTVHARILVAPPPPPASTILLDTVTALPAMEPLPEMVVVEKESVRQDIVATAETEAAIEEAAAEISEADSIKPKKTFSIGVIPGNGSR